MNTKRLVLMLAPAAIILVGLAVLIPFSANLPLASLAIILIGLAGVILPRRIRMERRARKLLAENPGAEQTSVYLQFQSARWSEKQKAHDAMVADMAAKGWTFLRASEARPILTWAGGVNMHFIKI